MVRYPVTIELLSETIFGNGESKNGVVNTEILLDKNGLPYFLGKTFKGYLRNAINTILKPHYENRNDKDFQIFLVDSFGLYQNFDDQKESDKKEFKQKEGKIRFNNFYLDKDIAEIFLNSTNKDLGLALLTDVRFAIKVEEGVSKDGSLRASRVLKKGLVFTGYIESDEKLSLEEYKFLKEGICALKNLGINKSRGKGLVKVQLGDAEEYINKSVRLEDKEFSYIFYELELKEPVKIGDSQSKYDYEESKLYITGASMRGAVINRYYKSFGDKNLNFTNLLKRSYFYDAYPIYIKENEKHFSFPTPNIFRISKERDKDKNREYRKDENEYSVVFDIKNEDEERKVVKLKKGAFSYYDEGKLYQFDVKKDYKFHHSQQIKKENIFRYESISKGQKFYGIIDLSKLDVELRKIIVNLMREKPIVYLGGSRTGGYGKTEITSIETIGDFNKLQEKLIYLKPGSCNEGYTDIYFLSDAVLRDEKHQITSSFADKYLENMLSVEAKDKIKYEITSTIITGFNSTWQSNLPQVYGIEKGSVLRIINSGKLAEEDILKFTKIQHGDRKQDGLGRVIINPDFFNVKEIKYANSQYIKDIKQYYSSNKVNKEVLECIKRKLEAFSIDKYIKDYVLKAEKDFKLTNAKINDVISIIDKCLNLKNNFEEFKRELLKLEEINQNEERNMFNSEILDKVFVKEYSLRKVIYLEESERRELIRKIVSRETSIDHSLDLILLKIIRNIFYYKQKESKVGEANVQQYK